MFIHTRDTLINTDMLEAVTISGLVITYHMANNDIEINYGSVDAAQRALSDLTQILKD